MRALPASVTRPLELGGRGLTVLVVRLGAMGDILRTIPPVRLLRRAAPEARLFWVLEEPWAVLLEEHSDLDGVITLPRRTWRRWSKRPERWGRLAGSIRRFRRELKSVGAGLALDFHGNLRSGVVTRISGAQVRLGYEGHQAKEANRWFTTHRVSSGDRRTPRMERNLDLVRALGVEVDELPPAGLPLEERGAAAGRAALEESGLAGEVFAVLSPGASRAQAYKKPPAALLIAACRRLAALGVGALVVHGPGEQADARLVVEGAGAAARLAPPTDLAALAWLLGRARLFVGGDSGPLHMACATGCPVLGIYGPTDPSVNRPWRVPYLALQPPGRSYTGIKRIDRGSGGFTGLDGSKIEAAVEELLARTGREASPPGGS